MDDQDKLLTLARWFAKKYLSESNFEYDAANDAMLNDSTKITIHRDNALTEKIPITCWKCDIAKDDLEFMIKYPENIDPELSDYYKDCEFPIDSCDANHEHVEDGVGYFYHEDFSEEEIVQRNYENIIFVLFEIAGFPESDEGELYIPPEYISDAIRNINRVLNDESILESYVEEAFEINETETFVDYNEEIGLDEIITEGPVYVFRGITRDEIEEGLSSFRDILMHAKLNDDGVTAS